MLVRPRRLASRCAAYIVLPLICAALIAFALVAPASATAQQPTSGSFGPKVPAQHERVRDYHVRHMLLRIAVNWELRLVSGVVTHTVTPLRDGLQTLIFDAGPGLIINSCKVNGEAVKFEHQEDKLNLTLSGPLPRDTAATVVIDYFTNAAPTGREGAGGFTQGFHWQEPNRFEPDRTPGFWTQGETSGNHEWVPLYDYPNDKLTAEVYVTVPRGWFAVGNGRLIDTTEAQDRQTYHWKMDQPFSTYLLSLAAGEMDVAYDKWNDVPLIYAVPRGAGSAIPTSFGNTKDMLTFFSERLGVKYPWPKYAQTAVFDFGGGMENVSATTLVQEELVGPRDEPWAMSSLNSHELAHQWFGDLVTCKDWGHIWLNEGFATFFQQLFTEHQEGKDAYDRERRDALRDYLFESEGVNFGMFHSSGYRRPIVTEHYENPDVMFDDHTYQKGGLVLHMLRRLLGDAKFFTGLHNYLTKYGYGNVVTANLIQSLQESYGQSLQPFFDQWVYKPGHPVIDFRWQWDARAKQAILHLAQTQDTREGTPIYTLDLPLALITNGAVTRQTLALSRKEQTFTLPLATRPDAILLDPDHDLLMKRAVQKLSLSEQMKQEEQEAVLRFAPCALDREAAAQTLLQGRVPDSRVHMILDTARQDPSPQVLMTAVAAAASVPRPWLRDTYRALLDHENGGVRAAAIMALGSLPKNSEDTARLRGLINATERYRVMNAALQTLIKWDAESNIDMARKALAMQGRGFSSLGVVFALRPARSIQERQLLLDLAQPDHPRMVRTFTLQAINNETRGDAKIMATLLQLLKDEDPEIRKLVCSLLQARGDRAVLSALRATERDDADFAVRHAAAEAANALEKPIDVKSIVRWFVPQ